MNWSKRIEASGVSPTNLQSGSDGTPFKKIGLFFQGGAALGAYQAGIYEALSELGIEPDVVSGISIGAINAAIIAGNPPQKRVEMLHQFWDHITDENLLNIIAGPGGAMVSAMSATAGIMGQDEIADGLSAQKSEWFGVNGLCKPLPPGQRDAVSYCETSEQPGLLRKVIDFDYLNKRKGDAPRLAVGAVNTNTGKLVYFDTAAQPIGVDEIMASGALTPNLPGVMINGEHHIDGGFLANRPIQWAIDSGILTPNTLSIEGNLFDPKTQGKPRSIGDNNVIRENVTHAGVMHPSTTQPIRDDLMAMLQHVPEDKRGEAFERLMHVAQGTDCGHIVSLTYQSPSKNAMTAPHDFSRASMQQRWSEGYHDALKALRELAVYSRLAPAMRERLAQRIRDLDAKPPTAAHSAGTKALRERHDPVMDRVGWGSAQGGKSL